MPLVFARYTLASFTLEKRRRTLSRHMLNPLKQHQLDSCPAAEIPLTSDLLAKALAFYCIEYNFLTFISLVYFIPDHKYTRLLCKSIYDVGYSIISC